MSRYNARRSENRKALRLRMAAMGLPCAICGKPIDYSLPHQVRINGKLVCNDDAFELDEIIPVSRWREGGYVSPEQCANDPNNHQPTHRRCNRQKSNYYIGNKPKHKKSRPSAPPNVTHPDLEGIDG